jgi:hypothetical protein
MQTQACRIIDRLFDRFLATWGLGAFERAYGMREALAACKAEWIDSDIADFSMIAIKKGLDHCKRSERYPPNLATFRAACVDAIADDFLTVEKAYKLACSEHPRSLPDPCRWAAMQVGFFDLRHFSESVTFPKFKKSYREAAERVAKGEELSKHFPAANVALASPERVTGASKGPGRDEFFKWRQKLDAKA